VDLSSHVVTDKIQLGCHFDNLGEFFYMQISAYIIEKSILFNIAESMHDTFIKIVSTPMFSRPIIRINTIRIY